MSEHECPLSSRELEILSLVVTGVTNAQIARDLKISPNTVKVHLRNIFGKLEVESRTEATTLAIRNRWVRVGDVGSSESAKELLPSDASQSLQERRRWEPLCAWQRAVFAVLLLTVLAMALWPTMTMSVPSYADAFVDHAAITTSVSARSGGSRWTLGAQMPTPRARLAFAALDGLLYAIGGDSALGIIDLVEVYDPRANLWTRRASKPTAVANVGAVSWQGRLYVPGGYVADGGATDVLEIYDPLLDTWQTGPRMPMALFGYAIAVIGDSLYVFGGTDGANYRDTTLILDLVGQQWHMGPSSGVPRGFSASAVDGEIAYVLGGYDGSDELDICQRYDARRAEQGEYPWSSCSSMLARRAGLGAGAVAGSVYAIGGGWQSHLYFNERYDPQNDVWSSLETPVIGQWRTLGVTALEQDTESVIYAVGGWNGAYLAVTERFRPLFYVNLPSIP